MSTSSAEVIISEIQSAVNVHGDLPFSEFDFTNCFDMLRALEAKVNELEAVNEAFKHTALELADCIENKHNLDNNKWAIRTAFQVNRVRKAANDTINESIVKVEGNAVRPVLRKLEAALRVGTDPLTREALMQEAYDIAGQVEQFGVKHLK